MSLLNSIRGNRHVSQYDKGRAPSYSFESGLKGSIDPVTGISNSLFNAAQCEDDSVKFKNGFLNISDNKMKAELTKLNPASIIPTKSVSTSNFNSIGDNVAPIKFQLQMNTAPMSVRSMNPDIDAIHAALGDYKQVIASGAEDCYNQAVSTYMTNTSGTTYDYTFAAYSGASPMPFENSADSTKQNCLICGLKKGSAILNDVQTGNTGRVVQELKPLTMYIGTNDKSFNPMPPLSKKYVEVSYVLIAMAVLVYVFRGL